jgi:hypothetical protein
MMRIRISTGAAAYAAHRTARPISTSAVSGEDDDGGDDEPPERRASLVSGLPSLRSELQEVDRRVHEHPHDVDEVPVDARHLDAAVLLGRVVARKARTVANRSSSRPIATWAPCRPVSP